MKLIRTKSPVAVFILPFTLFLASLPPAVCAQTYDDGKPSCRPAGTMPQGKNPLPSCDPIKHQAIVTKRAYDRSEQQFKDSKERVKQAEANAARVNDDSTSTQRERDRAQQALLEARARHQQIKEDGTENARAYKKAEDAMQRDRGRHLNDNSYEDAKDAVELADMEKNYNESLETMKYEQGKYGRQLDANGKPRLDKRGIPLIGGGGFVGGTNTNAGRKNRSGNTRQQSAQYEREDMTAGGRKTGYDAGWEDGGGDWKELGGEVGGKGKLASARGLQQSRLRMSDPAARSASFAGQPLRTPEQGSLKMVRGGQDGAELALARETAEEQRLGGPAVPFLREAEAALSQRNYSGAVKAAKNALHYDPANAEAHLLMARGLNGLGEYSRAEEAARKSLEKDPNNPRAYQELAWALLHQGRYEEAAKMASLAIRLDPDSADAYAMRAFAYEQMGKRDLMLADLIMAAKISPKYNAHLARAKNNERLFDPTSKTNLSLLTASPTWPMLEGKDPVKMSLFFLSALVLGIFAVWQVRRRKTAASQG